MDEDEFVEAVKALVRERTIVLETPDYGVVTFLDYLFSFTLSGWLWALLAITLISLIVILSTPDNLPLSLPRWVMGSIFVLLLPGYSVLQLLFPKGSELDGLERFALDIGLSLAVVPLVGLILNFTPWGLRFLPIVASLACFTVAVSVGAAVRNYMAVRTQAE